MLLSEFLSSPLSLKPHLVVLGHPVSHSRSPGIHNLALGEHSLNVTYHAVDCPENEWDLISKLFSLSHFYGANITIPLKKKIIQYLDDLDDAAREIGAVNTVVPELSKASETTTITQQSNPGRLIGYNTDTYGFMKPLETLVPFPVATILGTGGASQAIRYALSRAGTKKIYLVSRSAQPDPSAFTPMENSHRSNDFHFREDQNNSSQPTVTGSDPVSSASCKTISYSDLGKAVQLSDIIVNTTPAGMYPDNDASPVPDDIYTLFKNKICYDIIYNPLETKFLQYSKKYGATVIGGLDMFIFQAVRSFSLWFNKPMPVELIRIHLQKEVEQQLQKKE